MYGVARWASTGRSVPHVKLFQALDTRDLERLPDSAVFVLRAVLQLSPAEPSAIERRNHAQDVCRRRRASLCAGTRVPRGKRAAGSWSLDLVQCRDPLSRTAPSTASIVRCPMNKIHVHLCASRSRSDRLRSRFSRLSMPTLRMRRIWAGWPSSFVGAESSFRSRSSSAR